MTAGTFPQVRPWEVERKIAYLRKARHAEFCAIPEGKIGGYGHRALSALMLGCVPLYTKERFSSDIFEEARSKADTFAEGGGRVYI
jgi:hypothetical protein